MAVLADSPGRESMDDDVDLILFQAVVVVVVVDQVLKDLWDVDGSLLRRVKHLPRRRRLDPHLHVRLVGTIRTLQLGS